MFFTMTSNEIIFVQVSILKLQVVNPAVTCKIDESTNFNSTHFQLITCKRAFNFCWYQLEYEGSLRYLVEVTGQIK